VSFAIRGDRVAGREAFADYSPRSYLALAMGVQNHLEQIGFAGVAVRIEQINTR